MIDGRAWGEYNRQGFEHFERVGRSWSVFRLNASELRSLLMSAETNPAFGILVMSQGGPDGEGPEELRDFWRRLDQKLHNMVASAISLVDITRPLVDYYAPHEIEFMAEYQRRSDRVKNLPVSSFLRRFRNYLLHCGVAPLAHTLHLGEPRGPEGQWDNYVIQLSAAGLQKWSGWSKANRDYIAGFDPGPPLRKLTEEYFEEMVGLYRWLMEQRGALHVPGQPPAHLTDQGGQPSSD